MAKPPNLKVYRTPIGFHDAYVAAPSQKAALAAWGSDANLFARGVAELVIDPALTAEPLARLGQVIRKLRGTAAEQLATLPPDTPKGEATEASRAAARAEARPRRSRCRRGGAGRGRAPPQGRSPGARRSRSRPRPRTARADRGASGRDGQTGTRPQRRANILRARDGRMARGPVLTRHPGGSGRSAVVETDIAVADPLEHAA